MYYLATYVIEKKNGKIAYAQDATEDPVFMLRRMQGRGKGVWYLINTFQISHTDYKRVKDKLDGMVDQPSKLRGKRFKMFP